MENSRAERIHAQLSAVFAPSLLEIEDQSHLHAGHAGARPGGETHYKVTIRSEAFSGHSRVGVQRQILQCLKGEFDTGLHALSIDAQAL